MASRLAARAFARRGGAWWRPRRGLASYDASPRTYGEAPSSGTPEAFAASSVAQRVVLPDVCDHLRAHGYAVVDGALDSVFLANGSVASVLREEILSLADPLPGASSGARSSAMRPNATVLVGGDGATTTRLEKANIFEAEAHALAPERLATVPTLRAVAEDRSMLTLLNVMLPASDPTAALHFQAVKAQINAGDGACFPMHFDSDATLDARKITALTYLNPDWTEGDGGELVLYPFPAPPVKIAPLAGRVVLFSAVDTLHRVLPSAKRRVCFTTWFFAKRARSEGGKGPVPVPDGGDAARKVARAAAAAAAGEEAARGRVEGEDALAAEELRDLFGPTLRRHLAKVVHAAEWASSIEDAHPDTPARAEALETHWREVGVIARALMRRAPRGMEAAAKGAGEIQRLGVNTDTWFDL